MKAETLKVPETLYEAMRRHVEQTAPEEACGLASGFGNKIKAIYPITNVLHSAARFRMAGAEQVAAMLEMERSGCGLVAIFHSHPDGPQELSQRDLEDLRYPDCYQILWFCLEGSWDCQAFRLDMKKVVKVGIQLLDE